MSKYLLLAMFFLSSTIILGEVFADSQFTNKGYLQIVVQQNNIETPAAKAFAAAGAKVQSPVSRYLKDPILYPRSSNGLCTVPADGIPWPRFAIDVRRIAKELAMEQGKDIASYLMEYTGECPFLALLTLDELGLHEEAAKLALRLISKKNMHLLLPVSYCSLRTREITANMLVDLLYEYPRYPQEDYLRFMIVVGNAETVKLLNEKAGNWDADVDKQRKENELRGIKSFPESKNYYAKAANQINARLSLPEKKRQQRDRDELLFWQTDVSAPNTCNKELGMLSAARFMVVQKLRISTEYLIEKLRPDEITQETGYQIRVAIAIIMFQKENAAIPTMMSTVRRAPGYQQLVEMALQEIDTPEAKKALQELQAYE